VTAAHRDHHALQAPVPVEIARAETTRRGDALKIGRRVYSNSARWSTAALGGANAGVTLERRGRLG
jgi:hypothetical protein